jgi:hypothetical protein
MKPINTESPGKEEGGGLPRLLPEESIVSATDFEGDEDKKAHGTSL